MALNKTFKQEILKPALILLAITFICTLVLAVVNGFTSVVVNENKQASQIIAREKVLPEADTFEKVDSSRLGFTELKYAVNDIYKGTKAGNTVGYTALVAPQGYGGKIEMIVGFDTNYTITGLDIISMSETPGLGAKIKENEFINGIITKNANIGLNVVKGNASKNNEINAVTGATISSKAVTDGINCAVSAVKFIREGE